MKNTVTLMLLFFSFSCKKVANNIEEGITTNKNISKGSNGSEQVGFITCEEFLREIVLSSDLESIKTFNDVYIRPEVISESKIKIGLYVKNNLSENPGKSQIVENAISWLELIPLSKKLYDVTFDPENPKEIYFDGNLFDKYDLNKTCGSVFDQTSKKLDAEVQCNTIEEEMATGEECIFSNTTLDKLYKDTVGKKLVEDSQYLLKEIPQNDRSLKINKNGLIEIIYKVSNNKVNIYMEYDGGVTTITLEEKLNSINRTIIRSAD